VSELSLLAWLNCDSDSWSTINAWCRWGIWAVVRMNMLCATAHLQRQPMPSLGYVYIRCIHMRNNINILSPRTRYDASKCSRLELGPLAIYFDSQKTVVTRGDMVFTVLLELLLPWRSSPPATTPRHVLKLTAAAAAVCSAFGTSRMHTRALCPCC
jgi:hypothetical protein